MNFVKDTLKTIKTHHLIKPGDTIVVGVSGGADSIALLEILCALRQEWGLKLIVCHINHGLRKSADTDQRFVQRLCQKKDIVLKTITVSIPKNPRDSLEQVARQKRFAALIKTAKQYNADAIALGHHQNDLAETVLMRMIRGTGLQGLQAILPKRTIDGTTFIRPLIDQTRDNIESFLENQKMSFRQDPTNKDDKFLRNKIRNKLLNCLSTKYNPNIRATLARLAETASLDYEFLSQEADKVFGKIATKKGRRITIDLSHWQKHHPALQRMILRKSIAMIHGNSRKITLEHIHTVELFLQDPNTHSCPAH